MKMWMIYATSWKEMNEEDEWRYKYSAVRTKCKLPQIYKQSQLWIE